MLKKLVMGIIVFSVLQTVPSKANEYETEVEQNMAKTKNDNNMKYRGVVYDVGLQFSPGPFSVDPFNVELVKYDMKQIADELHANSVRVEGEEISRLVIAAEAAHEAGLHVLFNPWKMGADAQETISYMTEAAKAAEQLKLKGVDLIFVAGCEYTIFSRGAFPGETFNERVMFMIENGVAPGRGTEKTEEFNQANAKLNEILAEICKGVRANFNGKITYSSGTWEEVNWELFDIVGIDYYRRGESAEEYVQGLERYKIGKPLLVMELGSCAYEGAGEKGDGGFAVLQGAKPDGTGIYLDNKVPVRDEKEQADYIETQINVLNDTNIDGAYIYVFAFPIMPYSGPGNRDFDMTTFSLVKSFPKDDPRSKKMPSWEKKEAFDRLGKVFGKLKGN